MTVIFYEFSHFFCFVPHKLHNILKNCLALSVIMMIICRWLTPSLYLSRYTFIYYLCCFEMEHQKRYLYISWAISFVILSGSSISDGIAHHIFSIFVIFNWLLLCSKIQQLLFYMTHTQTAWTTLQSDQMSPKKQKFIFPTSF